MEPIPTPPGSQTPRTSEGDAPPLTPETSFTDTEALEDELIAQSGSGEEKDRPHVYGAQQHNLIVDARPTVNAYATQAMGMGTENMDNYPFATKVYLGIENIHVMRDSLNKVIDALKDSDVTPLGPSRDTLQRSNWLKHIANMLDGVSLIARQVGLQHSHVLIHCSDGWDRTSQLSSLSQLCLDPYFRKLDGIMVLVEKDWLYIGHMFANRAGHLSSEKWFQVENDRPNNESSRAGLNNTATNAIENAFLSAKGFFNKENSKSRDSLIDSDTEVNPLESSPQSRRSPAVKTSNASDGKHATKVKETSPIFHQFLDATFQLLYQLPGRLEFIERFLRRLLYHVNSCQYGNFLYNSEKERRDAHIHEKTRSVWSYFLARRDQWLNPQYNPVIDDNIRGQERLLFPKAGHIRWWNELFGRTDEEMNGPGPTSAAPRTPDQRPTSPASRMNGSEDSQVDTAHTAMTGIETADTMVKIEAPIAVSPNNSTPKVPERLPRSNSPMDPLGVGSVQERPATVPTTDRTKGIGGGIANLQLGSSGKKVDNDPAVGEVNREKQGLQPSLKQMEMEMA